jgi:hypothetical protein
VISSIAHAPIVDPAAAGYIGQMADAAHAAG